MNPFLLICCYVHNNQCSPLAVRYLAYLCDNATAGCDPDVSFEAGVSRGTTPSHSEHVWPSWRRASPHSSVGRLFTPPLAFLFVLSGCGTVTVSPSTHQTPAGVLGFINHSSGPSPWAQDGRIWKHSQCRCVNAYHYHLFIIKAHLHTHFAIILLCPDLSRCQAFSALQQ